MNHGLLPIKIGVAGILTTLLLAIFQPAAFFPAWLFAVLTWIDFALGCLLLLFIHRMTGGSWGEILRPCLVAGASTLLWAFLLSFPLLFGLRHLFPWAAGDHGLLLAKHPLYQSATGYIVRVFIYALVYGWLFFLAARSKALWAGPVGLIFYVLTTYLLSVDWIVSLEPGWSSSGFPVVLMASQAVLALALGITAAIRLNPRSSNDEQATSRTWNDLGNLMLAALVFWAYVSYGEFLIIWSSNLPAQVGWYLHRNAGGWHFVLIGLVLLHLLAPVLFLMCSRTRRRSRGLAWLTLAIAFLQCVYLYWLILPSFRPTGMDFNPLDFSSLIAVGGFFVFVYIKNISTEVMTDV